MTASTVLSSHILHRSCRVARFKNANPSLPLFIWLNSKNGREKTRKLRVLVDGGSESYLDMWRKAKERERKAGEFQKIVDHSGNADCLADERAGDEGVAFDWERKNEEFKKILEVPKEERDRLQRMQVIDRAAAALSAARAALNDKPAVNGELTFQTAEPENNSSILASSDSTHDVPGPSFWSWDPPVSESNSDSAMGLQVEKLPPFPGEPSPPVFLKERTREVLSIPFQSEISSAISDPVVSPIEFFKRFGRADDFDSSSKVLDVNEVDDELGISFSEHATEIAHVLEGCNMDEAQSCGVNLDSSRWWKETGIEQRSDGVTCKWTMLRGISADGEVEWQDKFWEAADDLGYKELGSEKSGRDAAGNVWREYWRESMWQNSGLMHMEKTADKWGKNGKGDEWQEKWFEHYDSSNKTEKSAHKWCSIDPTTNVDDGHAHIWHERWGDSYDGHGGSVKYTDKWAERCEGDGWTKWGDKWDEHFDQSGRGVKQGETWWQGKHQERWNRTWGEHHNGSGWIHKYGKSSAGEHWDTHVQEDTWYERYPHFGFLHCFNNSLQLRSVRTPSQRNDQFHGDDEVVYEND